MLNALRRQILWQILGQTSRDDLNVVLNALRRQILWQANQGAPHFGKLHVLNALRRQILWQNADTLALFHASACSTPYGDRSCGNPGNREDQRPHLSVLNALRRQILWQNSVHNDSSSRLTGAQRLTATDLVANQGPGGGPRQYPRCSTPYGDRSCGNLGFVVAVNPERSAQRLTATDLVAMLRAALHRTQRRRAQRLTATDLVAIGGSDRANVEGVSAQRLTATDLVATAVRSRAGIAAWRAQRLTATDLVARWRTH